MNFLGETRDEAAQKFRDWVDRMLADQAREFWTAVLVDGEQALDEETLDALDARVAEGREANRAQIDEFIARFFSAPSEPTH